MKRFEILNPRVLNQPKIRDDARDVGGDEVVWATEYCDDVGRYGGIRKAEAATLTSSRFPEIIRRDSTSFTAAVEKDKKEGREIHTGAAGSLKKDKSLYLCFWENQSWRTITHRIQCIRLSHVLAAEGTSTSDVNSPPQLKQAAIRCGPDTAVPHEVSFCVRYIKSQKTVGVLIRMKKLVSLRRIQPQSPSQLLSHPPCQCLIITRILVNLPPVPSIPPCLRWTANYIFSGGDSEPYVRSRCLI